MQFLGFWGHPEVGPRETHDDFGVRASREGDTQGGSVLSRDLSVSPLGCAVSQPLSLGSHREGEKGFFSSVSLLGLPGEF